MNVDRYVAVMAIQPETKDWTWVLERPCQECGFDTRSCSRNEIGRLSRKAAAPWPVLLAHPLARVRPDHSCWSGLEYGCHVRDAFTIGLYRVRLMLHEDDPTFANWDQDETAVAERYDLQDPLVVADALVAAAAALSDLYETLTVEQWARTGTRSDGSRFTVETFGRYFLHDPMHHIADVRRGYTALNDAR